MTKPSSSRQFGRRRHACGVARIKTARARIQLRARVRQLDNRSQNRALTALQVAGSVPTVEIVNWPRISPPGKVCEWMLT